ncbi:lipoprotein signal peptidase [Campylobacter sputorum subsp. bubulus]|uniref:Lipoprotein signal peptidase n=1 Tax=Campylobacter sputorum subsp. sputorum TaxID=32024 RepID=A0A381DKE6_9BACT|nr:signal peptidase II [Campylobacter sputorum]ASM34452.1 prolipoprotein signal peptidase II [Campylobacter sputorum aubsp. sputorum RM3237]KAB0582159.1 lipoprotein signal peptidase [Campylobacter sputorum subsp. sputorum]QEL04643.1 prolipoprotein signal peptidase II [Campylobacter sputorum subsp. sputorum]SUX09463.1 lipoprotein signal peptidase [Campylobacter sputorum subsp. bubulus]SUX11115.1 lipoprotein signal peptidase [Campylobacter sputorum subsp. sputorum]
MHKAIFKFGLFFLVILLLDQFIKQIFINGFRWNGEFFSLILTYNKGVAFSMFAFLEENLKYIQICIIALLLVYFIYQKNFFMKFPSLIGILIGAGSSNLLDRFIHGGVVDYVFWHKWFEFAVFNFADVMINISVGLILLIEIFSKKKDKNCKKISI